MHLKLAFIFWAVMVAIAIANGYLGETVIARSLGDYGAHLYKTFFIIAVIFIGSNIYVRKTGGAPTWWGPAVSAGVLWLACSITFEFIFGHYVFGFPWERLFRDYRIWEGRLWSLVLASEIVAPLVNAYFINRP